MLEVKSGEEDEVGKEEEEKKNNIMHLTLSKVMGSLMLPIRAEKSKSLIR